MSHICPPDALPRLSEALWSRATAVVARHEGLTKESVLRPRGLQARRARHVAAYLVSTGAGVSMRELARVAGVRRYTLQEACARIEALRDDPRVDRRLARLEKEIVV